MQDERPGTLHQILDFVTGRGATTAAVAATVFLKQWLIAGSPTAVASGVSSWLPVFGLAIGMPVTAAMATVDHNQNQRRLRDHYRGEVSAILGIPSKEVTMDHLRMVAEGNEKLNLPGNRALHEALQRNDRHRTIAVVANIAAAALVIGGVLALPMLGGVAGTFLEPVVDLVQSGLNYLPKFGIPMVASTVMAGLASFGLDVGFKALGNGLFGYNQPSLIDRIDSIRRNLRHGRAVSEEQMMSLIIDANPAIEREIGQTYNVPYASLPAAIRQDVIAKYDAAFELKATTQALNLGLLPASELAFTIEGVRSKAHPSPQALIVAYADSLKSRQGQVGEEPIHGRGLERVPGYEGARKFIELVRAGHPIDSIERSFADRVSQPHYSDTSKAIH